MLTECPEMHRCRPIQKMSVFSIWITRPAHTNPENEHARNYREVVHNIKYAIAMSNEGSVRCSQRVYLESLQTEDVSYFICRSKLNGLYKYEIFEDDTPVVTITSSNVIGKKYDVKFIGQQYTLEGDFGTHDFTIKKDGVAVATISKKYVKNDDYVVNIGWQQNKALISVLAMVIDDIATD
ncbi:unnamed protein product [Didymodactylos carnosus]|uniref:Uncharacterized protein n=1 Tax=Didymodactylos carnosus TaxID=1234261 RepID=A0A815NBQ3_9BILA|nr:unnamed protein product [Didymodactylos carnosus]CAF1435453.1 unnamed protein product [Didymodactylos carnosus]CAF4075951.1 unnamed protein product [Didymodactylos carnosus]CAF4312845.1 unnamed protein product [Didymodactylos carnosus]